MDGLPRQCPLGAFRSLGELNWVVCGFDSAGRAHGRVVMKADNAGVFEAARPQLPRHPRLPHCLFDPIRRLAADVLMEWSAR